MDWRQLAEDRGAQLAAANLRVAELQDRLAEQVERMQGLDHPPSTVEAGTRSELSNESFVETPVSLKGATNLEPFLTPVSSTKTLMASPNIARPELKRKQTANEESDTLHDTSPSTPQRAKSQTSKPSPRKPHTRRKRATAFDNETSDSDFATNPSVNKKQRSTAWSPSEAVKLEFLAIETYTPSGAFAALRSEDLRTRDDLEALWRGIARVAEYWEERKGEYWIFEFEREHNWRTKPCVTTRFTSNGKMNWLEGREAVYACGNCVKRGWPCFAWVEGGLRLLPLAEADMKMEIGAHLRGGRRWINEGDASARQGKKGRGRKKNDDDEEWA